MVKQANFKKIRKRRHAQPALISENIFTLLESMGGQRERGLLDGLWQNWNNVLGAELAGIAAPLGHKKDTLLLGAQDAMDIQELYLRSAEVLERVNNFLKFNYFSRLKVTLAPGDRKNFP